MNKFLLFSFRSNGLTHVTRGETLEQAKEFLIRICGLAEKDIEFIPSNLIHSAWVYSGNHPYNWLVIPPLWLNESRPLEPHDFSFRKRFENSRSIAVITNRKFLPTETDRIRNLFQFVTRKN